METTTIRNSINNAVYSNIVKKICFKFDEEKVHNFFVETGKFIGDHSISKEITNTLFNYQNPVLEQEILGIKFRNPIGLSAGFDKNAELISIMEDVGFGFVEVGSITAKPCKGNKGRRLIRLPEEKSIWVNLGLNNNGADEISSRLKGQNYETPFGVSVAKTNCKETVDVQTGIKDYIYTLKKFNQEKIGDYFTINISCPNASGGQPFSDPKLFLMLMKEISKLRIKRPIFVKLSPDLNNGNIKKLIEISEEYRINGFICSNLTKKNIKFKKGGMSGKKVSGKSDDLLSFVYKETRNWKNKPVLIGTGGVFSAEDAYKKIKLGANLVQLITGMIFNGPGLIGEINHDLVLMLKKDGYKNVGDAVGSEYL